MKGNQWSQIKVFELLHGHCPTDKALGNYMKSSHKRSGRPLIHGFQVKLVYVRHEPILNATQTIQNREEKKENKM